ncbi:transglutaminase TgpA family protein [Roseiconus lacunae]|uniref:transglutaminase TgpA family protein n=1 Tax=Roseiconus lacunae TaxID=2605694 RepID=UPI001E52B849|nr:transglutaminaseTgpA domain-containing protein [Roseiconus lacunae]MCD0463368.1 DUF3488 and transglutaminase-like domain-containing protein [Roseiconus lacunae]
MNGNSIASEPHSRLPLASLPTARNRLHFHFAVLSAAGGVVLGLGQGANEIALLSVFFAVFGFLFVDYLRLIALPQLAGYLAMGASAAYCIQDFWLLEQRGQLQMVSVALLLVLVQGILMMQRKTRRILEQLAVFCLLELVVAAIFNDAIEFGLMVLPISIIGANALCLLGLVTISENIESHLPVSQDPEPSTRWHKVVSKVMELFRTRKNDDSRVTITTSMTAESVDQSVRNWARLPLIIAGPAVCLVALTFFYLLPRRIDSGRSALGGPAMVGFSDEIRLEQLGRVMQNSKRALKVKLTNTRTGDPYQLQHGLYLRGKVLEKYVVDHSSGRPIAKWIATKSPATIRSRLPAGYESSDPDDQKRYDKVDVEITCESMSRPALFAIAPYHGKQSQPDVMHTIDRWTLTRDSDSPPYPAMSYRFETHAFHNGIQSALIPRPAPMPRRSIRDQVINLFKSSSRSGNINPIRKYQQQLLTFDRRQVPTASQLADRIIMTVPPDERSAARLAKEFAYFLATGQQFQYALDLTAEPIKNVDPIEQFLSLDRRGHCQYFSAALAMMLRSAGIPCRVVVGYRTDEFNQVGGYYIARQQHAHAWVEALIDADELPRSALPAGARPADWYWLRLDPTPAASLFLQHQDRTGAQGLMNLANNFWEDYVVDMDRDRQDETFQDPQQLEQIKSSYDIFLRQMKRNLSQFSPDSDAPGFQFNRRWLVSFLSVTGVVAAVMVLSKVRLRGFKWHFRWKRKTLRPTIAIQFYSDALKLLRRVGFDRQDFETPDEFASRLGTKFPPFAVLTHAFIQTRYGGQSVVTPEEISRALDELKQLIRR